jgi:death-on-curing protein
MIYLELGDLLAIATEVLGLEVDQLLHITDLGLADSALARPQASFGGTDFYPELSEKAASLLHSVAKNHAFLDGNKRVAVVATLQFLKLNGFDLDLEPPSESYEVIAGVAGGSVDFAELEKWLRPRLMEHEARG